MRRASCRAQHFSSLINALSRCAARVIASQATFCCAPDAQHASSPGGAPSREAALSPSFAGGDAASAACPVRRQAPPPNLPSSKTTTSPCCFLPRCSHLRRTIRVAAFAPRRPWRLRRATSERAPAAPTAARSPSPCLHAKNRKYVREKRNSPGDGVRE